MNVLNKTPLDQKAIAMSPFYAYVGRNVDFVVLSIPFNVKTCPSSNMAITVEHNLYIKLLSIDI